MALGQLERDHIVLLNDLRSCSYRVLLRAYEAELRLLSLPCRTRIHARGVMRNVDGPFEENTDDIYRKSLSSSQGNPSSCSYHEITPDR